jgi:diketogulonate reductase-like aldo/keto reductase
VRGQAYVDLYLIHWPVPSQDKYVDIHLERIIAETGVTPAVNQIELHPRLQQVGLRREHADRGIVTEAWSPLAQGLVLDDPAIIEIARSHGKTPAQIVIRWHL